MGPNDMQSIDGNLYILDDDEHETMINNNESNKIVDKDIIIDQISDLMVSLDFIETLINMNNYYLENYGNGYLSYNVSEFTIGGKDCMDIV